MPDRKPVVRTYMRLKGAVDSASDSIPEGQVAIAGKAYIDAYERLRKEIRSQIGDDLLEEFDSLFPVETHPPAGGVYGDELIAAATQANEARSLLKTLGGWLKGLIDAELLDVKMRAEADAYARARLEQSSDN